jgi:hypothetical protein
MQKVWICAGMTGATALLALLVGTPLKAQDSPGVRTVAEELDKRTKTDESSESGSKGLSDSAVRVMATFAWSIIPDEVPGPDGKPTKVDKSEPKKFFIPIEDARQVIKVATRSAYAEACNLQDLERANYEKLMRGEEARQVWSHDQLMFINALHMFSVSYFTGNVSMTEQKTDAAKAPEAGAEPAETAAASKGSQFITPKKLDCPPEQKEKVMKAIGAYIKSADVLPGPPVQAPAAAQKAAPQKPGTEKPGAVAGGAN